MPHKVIVIPKTEKVTSDQFCNSIGAKGDTFTVPLYSSNTHTHYWCGWLMTDEQAAACDNYFDHIYDDAETALTELGLNVGQPVDS